MPVTFSVSPHPRERLIIGLMSGTSLDGLDVALCRIKGSGRSTRLNLEQFTTVPYTPEFKSMIREVFACDQVDFLKLSTLHTWLGQQHGVMVNNCLKKWRVSRSAITAIASHGQTVFHAPAFMHPENPVNSTFQVGDGDQVAVTTGILTVSDFRQKHVAAGGEGAPLAVYGDFLLLAHKTENRILLNIGGIANFTYLPAGQKASRVWVTDTGPGNTLIDQLVRHFDPSMSYDRDARWAREGRVNDRLLGELKSHPFFKLTFPRTTGPELFNVGYVAQAQEKSNTQLLGPADLLATVTRFSAETIAESIRATCGKKSFTIYLSGGGAHNPLLVKWLGELLGRYHLSTTSELGVPVDAKEAILFAVLANETLFGKPINYGKRGKIPSVRMGKISFPD
ncbi:MAG: anhydro-N-acetylmuramic acid kinase [Cyclobacteriaceae bacterium]|jgi:anhydro-N-acetylmuramic acid kinase